MVRALFVLVAWIPTGFFLANFLSGLLPERPKRLSSLAALGLFVGGTVALGLWVQGWTRSGAFIFYGVAVVAALGTVATMRDGDRFARRRGAASRRKAESERASDAGTPDVDDEA